MRISDLAEVKISFEEADFWVIRSHDVEMVGHPVRIFQEDYIGIKVVRTDIVIPSYLFYAFAHLHSKGVFKLIAHGTTKRVHIRVEDIKNIPLVLR